MILFFTGSGIICIFIAPILIFRPKDYRNAMIPAAVCRILGRVIGVRMEIEGLENVSKDHGSVFVLNHQSALDLLVLAYLWPVIGRATVVAKRAILYIPFFGIGAYLWGTLFINRSQRTGSVKSLNKESKAIKEQKAKLLVFPEGTRNTKNTLLPFKKGAFHMALDNKCPIQPVVISKYYFLDSERKQFGRGHVIIRILPEISTEKYEKEDIEKLIKDCHSVMQIEYTKLSSEEHLMNMMKKKNL